MEEACGERGVLHIFVCNNTLTHNQGALVVVNIGRIIYYVKICG